MKKQINLRLTITKIVITCAALAFIAYLTAGIFLSWLGANPVEVITHKTGEWGLNFLMATLCVTPLRRRFHWRSLIKLRRFLGLWSFAFIFLHLSIFLVFDHFFDWQGVWDDIIERPYITLGMVAFVLMLPLAVTSFQFFQKKLGKTWAKIHRLVYAIAILGVLHYWWLVKADILLPLLYGSVLLVLLLERVYYSYKKRLQ